jgi:hypothetical protein
MPGSQLSASDRLIRECLDGDTPRIRVDKCSQAIASPELAHAKKRNPYDVRARAYEQITNMPGAEQDYRAVLSIDPNHPAAKARLEQLHSPAAPPAPAPPKRG